MENKPLELKNVWQLLYLIYFKPFTLRNYIARIYVAESIVVGHVILRLSEVLLLKNISRLELYLYALISIIGIVLLTILSFVFSTIFTQFLVGFSFILTYFTGIVILGWGYFNRPKIKILSWTSFYIIFSVLIILILYFTLPDAYKIVTSGVALGVTVSIIFGVGVGGSGGIAGGLVGSVGLVISLGIALGVALGVALGTTFVIISSITLGVALGVSSSMLSSIRQGITESMLIGGIFVVVFALISDVTLGITLGIVFCVVFIIFFLRLPIYIVELLKARWLALKLNQTSQNVGMAWQSHPLHYDEVILMPLFLHDQFIADLAKRDIIIATDALILTAGSKWQTWAAPKAVVKILEQEMGRIATIETIMRFYERTGWIPINEVLDEDIAQFVQVIRNLSHHIEGALQNTTEESTEIGLRQVIKTVDSLRARLSRKEYRDLQPLGIYLQQWREILEKESKRLEVRRNERGLLPQRYIAGNPLEENSKTFRGRDDLFQKLEELVVNTPVKVSPLLLGQPRTGKTSVLKQFPSRLGSGIVSVYMDLEGDTNVETIDAFFLQITNRILNAIQRQRPDSGIIAISSEELKNDPYITFQNWLEEVENIFIEQDLWLFLTLDEFYKLDEAVKAGRIDERIFNWIRTTLQQRQRVVIALCGTFDLSECDPRWYEALKNVQTLPVSYLRPEDARRVFVQPAPDFPANVYNDEAVTEVLRLTGSQPYLIHLLGQLLVEGYNKTRYEMPLNSPSTLPITLEHVHGIIPLVYERGNNFFESFWRSWLLKIAAPYEAEAAALLPAIARGNSPAMPSAAEAHLLNLYCKRDLLTKQANGTYTYQVPLIGRWIAEHK